MSQDRKKILLVIGNVSNAALRKVRRELGKPGKGMTTKRVSHGSMTPMYARVLDKSGTDEQKKRGVENLRQSEISALLQAYLTRFGPIAVVLMDEYTWERWDDLTLASTLKKLPIFQRWVAHGDNIEVVGPQK